MQCECGYEHIYDGDTEREVKGEFGEFYHSTFADLERRKDKSGTEKAKVYGCPACGRVFIDKE